MAAAGTGSYELRDSELNMGSSDDSSEEEEICEDKSDSAKDMVKLFRDRGVCGFASFNKRHLYTLHMPTGGWMEDLNPCKGLTAGIAYGLFYRHNIPAALRLLQMMDLSGASTLDKVGLTILKAECEIVMGDNNSDLANRVLLSLRSCVIEDNEINMHENFTQDFDSALKKNGRHIGSMFLYYMAYYSDLKKLDDGDWKMHKMTYWLTHIAKRFTSLPPGRRRYIASHTLRTIFQDWSKEPDKLSDGDDENKSYIKALCCNYEAWICIQTGLNDDALQCVSDGVGLLQGAYRDDELFTLTLYGDLYANRAAALVRLDRFWDAVDASKVASKAYCEAKDRRSIPVARLIEELKKTGVNPAV